MPPVISQEECEYIAKNAFGESVSSVEYTIKAIDGERKGFLGDYFTLDIYARDVQNNTVHSKFFVKIPPPLTESQHDDTNKIFAKEAVLYSTILNDLSKYSKTKWRPECFLARNDILVLEDLTEMGFDSIPQNVEENIKHLKLLLSNVAAMHASSIAYEKDIGKSISSRFDDELFETSILKNLEWFQAGIMGLKSVAAIHPKYQSDEHQRFINDHFIEGFNPIYDFVNESDQYRNVLCHRDTWLNNGLFRFEDDDYQKPIENVLVDFQLCRYCPPAIDVLFTIYLNTNRQMRLNIQTECLKWYHQQLAKELKDLNVSIEEELPWNDFLESCMHLELAAVAYNAVVATLVKLPKGFLHNLKLIDNEAFENYRTVSRNEILLRFVESDENFRECMFDVIDDLMNMIYDGL